MATLTTEHKPYPTYRPSAVEWLGRTPAYWEVRRLKDLFKVVNGATPKTTSPEYWDGKIVWVTPDDLGKLSHSEIRSSNRRITDQGYDSCGATLVPEGSLVLSTRAPIGHLAIAGVPLCTNQGCRSLVFRRLGIPRYFYYQFLAARPIIASHGQGSTFAELARDALSVVQIIEPPLAEQRAIVAFLDRETAKIDSLIVKKEQLIELLREKRAALISRAVTKGINPVVPMKDSGVEWLGMIPNHWEVERLMRVVTFQRGHDLPSEVREEGSIPVISSSGTFATHSNAVAKAPGIVTGRYGTIGKFYLMVEDYWPLNTTLYSIDLHGNEPRFLQYMLTHLAPLFLLHASKSAVPGIDRNDVHVVDTAVPPITEQHAIADFLEREIGKLDNLVGKVQEAIGHLKEFRAALISAAVTGKIDVREEAA